MRFATIFLGLFLAAGTYAAALPTLEQRQVLATRGEQHADESAVKLGEGEEATADEDITWNVQTNYPPSPASK